MEGKVFYVTKQKLEELKKEYEELVALERAKTIGEEAPKVLESEDINPEFISFQEDMTHLRTKIEELKNILDHHELIKIPSKDKQKTVGIGATVKVEENGKHAEFTIVGTLEANPDLGKISNESPVGLALLGRTLGEQVAMQSPSRKTYIIKQIKYQIS